MIAHLGQTFVSNLPLLLLLLPIIGAVLVFASARLGLEGIRRTALTNSLLSTVLAALVAIYYQPEPRTADGLILPFQMISVLRWFQNTAGLGLPVQIAVGLDGFGVGPVLLTVLAMGSVLRTAGDLEPERPALFYAALLLLEAATLGVFIALDAVLLVVCLGTTVLLTGLLVGGWGGVRRHETCRAATVVRLAGVSVFLLGILGLVAAAMWVEQIGGLAETVTPTFAMPRLTGLRADAAQSLATASYWVESTDWIFAALLIGTAVLAPVVPLHPWLTTSLADAPVPVRLLIALTAPLMGTFLLGRVLVPLFPEHLAAMSDLLTLVLLMGATYSALLAIASADFPRTVIAVVVCLESIALAGIVSLVPSGVAGGMLLSLTTGGFAALALYHEARLHNIQTSPVRLAIPALALLPGLGLVAWALARGNTDAGGSLWHALLAVLAATLAAIGLASAQSSARGTDDGRQRSTGDFLAALPLWLVLLTAAVAPGFLLARIAPTAVQILAF